MSVKHIETDITDETTIKWYEIDGVAYGLTGDYKVLDSDGVPVVNDTHVRWAIERFEAAAATTYEAVRYAADGHQGEVVPYGDSDNEVIWSGDLEECRNAIAKRIGQMDSRRWDGGNDDIEAYHDSEDEGCGGYAIRRVD